MCVRRQHALVLYEDGDVGCELMSSLRLMPGKRNSDASIDKMRLYAREYAMQRRRTSLRAFFTREAHVCQHCLRHISWMPALIKHERHCETKQDYYEAACILLTISKAL